MESVRDDHTSTFECFYREARVRQRVEFKVSNRHRTVSFDEGSCICSDDPRTFGGKGETPIGAACFFRDRAVETQADYNHRLADALTRGVIMRGPIFSLDFGDVCDAVDGASATDATATIEAWATGAQTLPAPEEEQ